MPISIHLPTDVLRQVDRRARTLGLSRSGYIAQALKRDAQPGRGWSPGFIDQLRDVDDAVREEADLLAKVVGRRRSRKVAPKL
jgi:predicted transcriptional regulator